MIFRRRIWLWQPPARTALIGLILLLLQAGCAPVAQPNAHAAGALPVAKAAAGRVRQGATTDPELRRIEIGRSAGGLAIEAYRFGRGPARLVLIGGIHGGYEWNTILLAYAVVDYYRAHAAEIPPSITLDIVPAANPDGQLLIVGKTGPFAPTDVGVNTLAGRFNRNGVDLNRNWDCDWAPVAHWRSHQVSGRTAPFSEAETGALRVFLSARAPAGVVLWHSAAGGVFAGGCGARFAGVDALAAVFAQGSDYPFRTSFASYPVTGDAADWLAREDIPAIAVELNNHDDLDMAQNLGGIKAMLAYLDAAR